MHKCDIGRAPTLRCVGGSSPVDPAQRGDPMSAVLLSASLSSVMLPLLQRHTLAEAILAKLLSERERRAVFMV